MLILITLLLIDLQTGMGLYYENQKVDLQESQSKVSEDDTNEAVLADLQQRQEGEFQLVVEDIALKVGHCHYIERHHSKDVPFTCKNGDFDLWFIF